MKSLEAAMEVDHMQVMAILFNFKGGGSLLSERRMQEEAWWPDCVKDQQKEDFRSVY